MADSFVLDWRAVIFHVLGQKCDYQIYTRDFEGVACRIDFVAVIFDLGACVSL